MNNPTITKNELIELGYGTSSSAEIIKKAKQLMVNRGFEYYENTRLGRVPIKTVEDILGVEITLKQPLQENGGL
ncbi:DUF3173 family protein [Vagococcus silagei]|uniref:DUF3173 domain-containing protein n=1 Tax=Vagococcus silagei TaxID=2508885 RepID=A0A4S3B0N0_9ENTE|nr:DUF3173 family protein [Vagococcus silagei]THB60561.1 DUF3173 domain-containing protein [Vagococcus silagei]